MSLVGERLELDIGPVAHGGHCVARWGRRVVFVRHTLPGERVVALVTEGEDDSAYLRADAVDILHAAPGRVPSRCPVSGPGGCGGCDFQHVDVAVQRLFLGQVVREQLRRLAGIEREVDVQAVGEGVESGLGWRTRVTFTADAGKHLGLHRHRSHDVVPLDTCPIAHPGLPDVLAERWPAEHVTAIVSSSGERLAVVEGVRGALPKVPSEGAVADGERVSGRTYVLERVRHREFRVSAAGFWQVHPDAASSLVDAVLVAADVQPGDRIADLYAGVGLFSAFLAEQAGPDGAVVSVEGDRKASRDARRSMHDLDAVHLVNADVEDAIRGGFAVEGSERTGFDVVVLDPPRTGARAKVVRGIAALRPRRVVYVACDPAALARDLKTFAEQGYELADLQAYDLFPMTQHVECVALLVPARTVTA